MESAKKKRLEVYEQILELYENNENIWHGICLNIHDLTKISPDNVYSEFPELAAQKPEHKNFNKHWWPLRSKQPRINALKKAIELCQ